MNFIEIKILQSTPESREFMKLNEKEIVPCSLYKTTAFYVDFERITTIFPHSEDENVTNVDAVGMAGFMVPMKYKKFKEFYNSKIKLSV